MDKKTVNIDVDVHYQWYGHSILRDNGDAKIVTKAIEEGDFNTFCEIVKKYPKRGGMIYFPQTAYLYYRDEIIGFIDITTPLGFSLITSSKYECG